MEQLSQSWQLLAATLITLFLLYNNQSAASDAANNTDTRKTVKKDQAPPPISPAQDSIQKKHSTVVSAPEKEVVISEKALQASPVLGQSGHSVSILPQEDVHIERSNVHNIDELPDTYAAIFYVLVGITSAAIFLLAVRIYRLRLSRAERKYGVQGDRANQELTPLPMAIEDVNSDEDEDHTLFEVNRQSIRIL